LIGFMWRRDYTSLKNRDLGVLGDAQVKKIAVIIHRIIIPGRCDKEKDAHHSCIGAQDFRVAARELPEPGYLRELIGIRWRAPTF
jgi:hypothetical protein